jgi:hypothetical protein
MSPIPYASLNGCTVYVQRLSPSRLNSQNQIDELTDRLRLCFEDYGNILDIIVKRSNLRKGQAFVVYDTPEAAATAQEELDGFEFSPDNPIVTSIANTPSDAVVEKFCSEEEFKEHKERRLAEKGMPYTFPIWEIAMLQLTPLQQPVRMQRQKPCRPHKQKSPKSAAPPTVPTHGTARQRPPNQRQRPTSCPRNTCRQTGSSWWRMCRPTTRSRRSSRSSRASRASWRCARSRLAASRDWCLWSFRASQARRLRRRRWGTRQWATVLSRLPTPRTVDCGKSGIGGHILGVFYGVRVSLGDFCVLKNGGH